MSRAQANVAGIYLVFTLHFGIMLSGFKGVLALKTTVQVKNNFHTGQHGWANQEKLIRTATANVKFNGTK